LTGFFAQRALRLFDEKCAARDLRAAAGIRQILIPEQGTDGRGVI